MKLSEQIERLSPYCTRLRRELHRVPELGFDCFETQQIVLRELEQCRPDRLEKIAVTGVKAVFLAPDASETIAFRADMDGLPNPEDTDCPWRSDHPGQMHGCGHDGHMAALLTFARWLCGHRDAVRRNVVLLFQPGEEGWGGARRMIEDGALDDPCVDRVYGLHLWPTVSRGRIGVRWGEQMAQTSDFEITVRGKSAHASTPQMGIDAIVVSAELITMIQTVVTRDADPHQDVLLTLGKICGGTAHNVIAEEVKISGTLRTLSDELFPVLASKVHAIAHGLEVATGAAIRLERKVYYPVVRNPRPLVERLYDVLDSMDDTELVEPVMAAEDFSEYQQRVPGVFFFLGVNGGRGGAPLHSAAFDFDEDVLLVGAEVYRRLALE